MTSEEEFKASDEEVVQVFVPGLGNVTSTSRLIGSSTTNAKEDLLGGFNFTTPSPMVVLVQPRQNINAALGFPDQFAVQVVYTDQYHILVRTTRVDSNLGWGQNLRLDILVVDKYNP